MPILDFSLTDQVALVTGASRGIGEAIARGFAEQGATVVLASRKQEGLDKVAESIEADGGKAVPIACHAGNVEQIADLFERIESEFGRLDILVNNAATNPYFGPAIASRTPVGRHAQPNEIAGAAVFLASKMGSYVTGATIVMDGGSSA